MNPKRVALVTGGTRGIGLGIAGALCAEKMDLVLCGRRGKDHVEDVLKELEDAGAQVLYEQADISSRSDREGLLKSIDARFGRLDVLVNNAGVAPDVRADILEATEESFEKVMKINLQGPYFLTQSVANWMIRQRKENPEFAGCIINISSISSTVASPSRGEYCISKAGISMATMLWAARLGEYDIPVYEIRPGIIKTDMTAGVTEKYDKSIEGGLLVQKRWGLPEDVGRAAAAFARGDFAYATGQAVEVDGGLTLSRL